MIAREAETGLAVRILRYSLTPGIVPRVQSLAATGFRTLSYFMALVFSAVGILPPGHAYLQRRNFGKYGIRHVIAEAFGNLTFSWKKIDQVIIFFTILAGIVLLALQFAILILMAFTGSAFAGLSPIAFSNWFEISPAREQTDLAYRLLDMTFGVPNLFGNHVEGLTSAYHTALHDMFGAYSFAILVVGVIILAYFVGAVSVETAATGTPFGKRFNHAWAPLRIVAGIGLLIPVGMGNWSGFNAGQWIALYAAKFGSNFASNGWVEFNNVLTTTYLGDPEGLIGLPNTPEMQHLPAFFMIAHACDYAEEELNGRNIDAYIVTLSNNFGEAAIPLSGTNYDAALNFTNKNDIIIRFGERGSVYSKEKGFVYPYCGELTLQTNALTPGNGAYEMQKAYYDIVRAWLGAVIPDCTGGVTFTSSEAVITSAGLNRIALSAAIELYGDTFIDFHAPVEFRKTVEKFTETYSTTAIAGGGVQINHTGGLPSAEFKEGVYAGVLSDVTKCIAEAARVQRSSVDLNIDPRIFNYGWAGAAIWYNKIAQMNGSLAAAVQAVPRPSKYPAVMETTLQEKLQQDDNVDARTRFCPQVEQGRDVNAPISEDDTLSNALCYIQRYWEDDGLRIDASSSHTKPTNNMFIDGINAILGTQGVFDLCRNKDVHPLAQLAMAGKSLVESSMRNLGFSVASGAAGGLAYIYSPHVGAFGAAMSGFFSAVAGIGLLIGVILFYVIPFMPFVYFFFAVTGWVKGLFEAMVGIPLWALAHIRIDGEGLPGEAAQTGYFLIFEIFLRPIIIVFSLIAAILAFSAMVVVLNDIFFLVASNLSGFNPNNATACGMTNATSLNRLNTLEYFRGPVDEFFFTIMYALIVYLIGMSCFKLIDTIPNGLLRWMNFTTPTFHDGQDQPAENLVQNVAIGGGAIGSKLSGAGKQLGEAFESGGKFLGDAQVRSSAEEKFS